MRKKQIRYIHTIDGKPAFYDGYKICYAFMGDVLNTVKSLSEIKKQRRATIRWRKEMGFETTMDYSHIRISV